MNTSDTTTTASAQPRVSMLLSTGRTVAHERMNNGAQHAYIIGSATGEMTEKEWEEYCALIVHGQQVENYMLKNHPNVI